MIRSKISRFRWFACGLIVSIAAGVFAADDWAWDEVNDPSRINAGYDRNYHSLSRTEKAFMSRVPWASSYFPYATGSFLVTHFGKEYFDVGPREADGSQYYVYQGPLYRKVRSRQRTSPEFREFFTADELAQMTPNDLVKTLSPTEVLDVLNGNTDPRDADRFYAITRQERAFNRALFCDQDGRCKQPEGWEGNCQGWAPASLAFGQFDNSEIPFTLKLSNGESVVKTFPFMSYHWKALITRFYAKLIASHVSTTSDLKRIHGGGVGGGTGIDPNHVNPNTGRGISVPATGTNAGSFHIILTNDVGPNKPGVVMDLDAGNQIWNYPIYGYEILNERRGLEPWTNLAAPGTAEEVQLRVRLWYQTESTDRQWLHPKGSEEHHCRYLNYKEYDYRLELSASGEIIGGRWGRPQGNRGWVIGDHPETIWQVPRYDLNGDYAVLKPYLSSERTNASFSCPRIEQAQGIYR